MLNPFLYADLTGPIVDFCVRVINDTGLVGVFLLMWPRPERDKPVVI